MSSLYTRDGVPLQVNGDRVFNPSGKQFGRIQGSKVYGSNGRYVGTIDGDRLVHRTTDAAAISSPFAPSAAAGSAAAHVARSALWGDEPNIDG